MTGFDWNDPDLAINDDFVKFESVGDTVTGEILNIRKHVFDDGKVVPQLILKTDTGERTVSAGQVRLKAALAEKRPGIGQTVTITLTEIEKRSGGKTLKHFDVTIGGGGAAAPAVTASAPAAPAVAADGDLTPEQVAAKKLLGLA